MASRKLTAFGIGTAALLIVSAAAAQPPADTRRGEDFPNIGGAMNRDLPPRKLVPDTAAPPKGAAEGYPAGLAFRSSPLGLIYTDAAGRTLYQAKVSFFRLRGEAAMYCTGYCATIWTPVAAPADAKPVGAWNVVVGARGQQWAYGRFPVYTYTGDKRAGDINGHEFEDMFLAINYVPPLPAMAVPGNVAPLFRDYREYILADAEGRALYGYAGGKRCKTGCDKLSPLSAGLGNRPIGDWTILPGDRPQWAYKGKRVFVAADNSTDLIDAAAVLRP